MKAEFKTLLLDEPAKGVLRVTLNRPDKLNALSTQMVGELTELALSLAEPDGTEVVVLTGAGRAFCAGMDLTEQTGLEPGMRRASQQRATYLLHLWERLEQRTLAAINGDCIGGGMVLALASDFRLMAEGVYFMLPEVERGFPVGWGSLPGLVRTVGPAKAKELALLSTKLPAAEAKSLGMVTDTVPATELKQAAFELAARLAAMPAMASRVTKAMINAVALSNSGDTALMEPDLMEAVVSSPELMEAITKYFNRKSGG